MPNEILQTILKRNDNSTTLSGALAKLEYALAESKYLRQIWPGSQEWKYYVKLSNLFK